MPIAPDNTLILRFQADRSRNGPRGRLPPRRPRRPPSFKPSDCDRSGLWSRARDAWDRRSCWAFAVSGATLFRMTIWLARNGFLSRSQISHLLRWSIQLHRIAIRLLRRGHW